MPWTIYCHTHVASGRRYVGITRDTWRRRWNKHVWAARARAKGWSPFASAIREYGPVAFAHEVLEVCSDRDVANVAEASWIEFHETRDPAKGFNVLRGGDNRRYPMQSQSPERVRRRLEAMRATVRSPEHREKLRAIWALRLTEPAVVASLRIRAAAARERITVGPRAMQTHCKRGHEFTHENTIVNRAPSRKGKGVSRVCRTCKREEERTAKRKRVRTMTPEQRQRKTELQRERRKGGR